MFAQKDHVNLRDTIQLPVQSLDENWESVKEEATHLVAELQETYDDMMRAFKEIVDRRRERRQKPVVRFVRHYPWVPLALGLGTMAALVIATRSR